MGLSSHWELGPFSRGFGRACSPFFSRFLKPVPSFLAPNGGVKVQPDFPEIQ